MRPSHENLALVLAAAVFPVAGCKCTPTSHAGAAAEPSASSAAIPAGSPAGVDLSAAPTQGPIIGAKGLWVVVRDKPNESSDKIGYIRLGGIVGRDPDPVSKTGCPGGWYQVRPHGYACNDDDATLDPEDPILRAASKRPDLDKPMPYAYGFVRAVLPLYLKIPNQQEQLASEFKLKEHLEWFEAEGRKLNRDVPLGANDVFTDSIGVPHDEIKVKRLVTDMSEGELFGGRGDDDPIPWWLEGSRKIPNVSGFKVPDFAVFADRARRHAGLSFVGSFPTGPDSFNRRFAITVDLRLAPATKVKPDRGSPFHGVALDGELTLPVAWVNEDDARAYKIEGDKVRAYKKTLPLRTVVKLTGRKKLLEQRLYYETTDGKWLRASQIAIAAAPAVMPDAAKAGEKWIDVSIMQQTLVLWEGQKPVYATLVSTGQDMMGDPKTTKSTVRGTFRIFGKHITTAMDSSEGLTRDTGDPEYGKTKRRGQGTFLLADVPWVQYFKGSYALHGTYWHDVFGHARSHGCVNLSPIDAHRVFFWTTPNVPQGWHGVYARGPNDKGTVVYIHE
jgi:lipoprotein-anchoring transpeptidase ErfK/SrfK